jgi:hypothetical protein
MCSPPLARDAGSRVRVQVSRGPIDLVRRARHLSKSDAQGRPLAPGSSFGPPPSHCRFPHRRLREQSKKKKFPVCLGAGVRFARIMSIELIVVRASVIQPSFFSCRGAKPAWCVGAKRDPPPCRSFDVRQGPSSPKAHFLEGSVLARRSSDLLRAGCASLREHGIGKT